MEILLEEFYKADLHTDYFIERKTQLSHGSYEINGITKSGKTTLIKHYLLSKRKSSYLYINCQDLRINPQDLNKVLPTFCHQNSIECLALDHYNHDIHLPNVPQLIISSELTCHIEGLEIIRLYPLDYEEFLAYEHKFDSTALNHFLQLGGFPAMHRISSEERLLYIQHSLRHTLNEIEFDIMLWSARMASQKVSAFMLYERLKQERKISKDMLYKSMAQLLKKGYIHHLPKYGHSRATKKLYLCDHAIKNALSTQKHFGRLFENLVFLEMLKRGFDLYYDEGIDFYLPTQHRAVLCMPFANQEMLFKKIESVEAFIITHAITKVDVVTMNSEGTLHHPFVTVEMTPFTIWALVEGEV